MLKQMGIQSATGNSHNMREKNQGKRFNPSDPQTISYATLWSLSFSRTHGMIQACGNATLCPCSAVVVIVSAMMWKGLAGGINAQCNRWCLFLCFLFSTRSQIHTCTYRLKKKKQNKRILGILPSFWAALLIKSVHLRYPNNLTSPFTWLQWVIHKACHENALTFV